MKALYLFTGFMLASSIGSPNFAWGQTQADAKKKMDELTKKVEEIEVREKKTTEKIDANKTATDAEIQKLASERSGEQVIAKETAQRAEATAAEAKKSAEEAQGTVSSLRNGRLMSMGLTGGVALALQFDGPFNRDHAKHTGVALTGMPYLMVMPFYWGTSEVTREACVSSWGGGDEATSYAAARAVARKRAERIFDSVVTLLRAPSTPPKDDDIIKFLALNHYDDETDFAKEPMLSSIREYVAMPKTNDTERKAAAEKKDLILDMMANVQWRASLAATCWHKRLGVWVGAPLNYDATTSVPDPQPTTAGEPANKIRSIKPIVAFGLGFSPNAYFSILAGFSASTVEREAVGDDPLLRRTIWSTTLAIGGTLDIAAALTK